MRRRVIVLWVVAVVALGAFVVAAGCEDKKPSGGNTNAAPASSTTTTSTLQPTKYLPTTFPARGAKPAITRAVKGGTGVTLPDATSKRLSERGTDRQMRKPALVDKVDCNVVPDNAAECDGNQMFFCDDQRLWVVDCDAEAKFGGASSGSCFEAETFTECLGCDKASDGSTACCDFEMTVCCDEGGSCYSPKR
jgi:hypothetical protein